MTAMKREPAVAGRFYPRDPLALRDAVKSHIDATAEKHSAIGVVAPHAGFKYSGDVAGSVYSRLEIPETVLLLGPNHTGMGERISLMAKGTWSMPFGDLEIDSGLAQALLAESPHIFDSAPAHLSEHSIETQLPFLQYFREDFKFVPICLQRLSLEECRSLSEAISRAAEKTGRDILIVASSDMTHYETHASAEAKDRKAIERILKLDPEGLRATVEANAISMCGVNPVTVMLMAAKDMGATQAELANYMTSGETTGDFDSVVGYAGMLVR